MAFKVRDLVDGGVRHLTGFTVIASVLAAPARSGTSATPHAEYRGGETEACGS
jgi:hypothetical protein